MKHFCSNLGEQMEEEWTPSLSNVLLRNGEKGKDSLLAIARRIAFQTNSKKYKLLKRVKYFLLKSQGQQYFYSHSKYQFAHFAFSEVFCTTTA